MEDNPRNNMGCGLVAVAIAFIPLVIGWVFFPDSGDYFAVSGTLAGIVGGIGLLMVVVNATILVIGERSAATVGKVVLGLLFLFLGGATPFIWPGSYWVMVIPFIPIPYVGNVFLVGAGVGLLVWAVRE